MSNTRHKKFSRIKPSLLPQESRKPDAMGNESWYYEHPSCIDLYAKREDEAAVRVRIPWSRLMRSAWRCGQKLNPAKRRSRNRK